MVETDILKYSIAEPLGFCLHSVKKLITSILNETKATSHKIYLTGNSNFRDTVAVTKPYKGNRDKTHKPIHYTAIKEYLIDKWNAEVINGMEADDAMGIAQSCSTVICSLDKDMLMIPGQHYNWRTGVHRTITKEEADRHFYYMMLTGDVVDNIKGVPKIGPAKADKILSVCSTEKEMWEAVQEAYYVGYYKHGSLSLEDFHKQIDNIILEHAKLLWINRLSTLQLPKVIEEYYGIFK